MIDVYCEEKESSHLVLPAQSFGTIDYVIAQLCLVTSVAALVTRGAFPSVKVLEQTQHFSCLLFF